MFWPSADESLTADIGARTRSILHVAVFGMKPFIPDLTADADEIPQVKRVNTVSEVTSFMTKTAFKMADNISQSGVLCQRLMTTPIMQEIALWKHHGSVG